MTDPPPRAPIARMNAIPTGFFQKGSRAFAKIRGGWRMRLPENEETRKEAT